MINNFKKGFTLVEVLVSITIFTVISVGLVNIMVVAVWNQKRILQNQKLLDEASYALEYMTKSVTMAKIDTSGNCTGSANTNFGYSSSPSSITFLAYNTPLSAYRCRRFLLSGVGGSLQEQWSSDDTNASFSSATSITSSKVKVDKLTFGITGDTVGMQPKVTIMLNMEANTTLTDNPQITVQTSVSQRYLNVAQ